MIIWQLGARSWLGTTTPAPTEVLEAGWELIRSGELWQHLAASGRRVAVGLAIGIGIGLVCGVAAGLFRIAEDLVNGPLQALRMLPTLALVPVFIIWFLPGVGTGAIVGGLLGACVILIWGVSIPVGALIGATVDGFAMGGPEFLDAVQAFVANQGR
ncbi:ABC transporter permease [Nocardia gipuzkoensis]